MIFGYTKIGKTTGCHILSNSPLVSTMQNGDCIYIPLPKTKMYTCATIGVTNNSQT
jgi:hypothetical protein